MYRLLCNPRPTRDLGGWDAAVGPFTEVVGWTYFGDLFLRNPDDGYYAMLVLDEPRFVALRYNDRASFEGMFLRPGFVERRLRPADVLVLERRLGTPGPDEVFVPSALPANDGREQDASRKSDVWAFAALAAARHGIGDGSAFDLLLRHLRRDDDPDLWRVAVHHVLAELSAPAPGTLVEIGRCSHWLRPHQTRWTADGGFAWPTGYGSGLGGFSRDALPQFDWLVTLAWTGLGWGAARDRSAKPAVRLTIPSRTSWHEQAAVHALWMTGGEKERRFYGFRFRDGTWRYTAQSDWREDRVRDSLERPQRRTGGTRRARRGGAGWGG